MVQETQTRTIEVSVNNKAVRLTADKGKPERTGLEIKSAAIEQGVQISADFPLFEIRGHELVPIGDQQAVVVRPNQKFRAVAPDDNS